MKKLLAVLICVVMVVSVCCAFPLTAQASDTLTITDDQGHSVTVKVGQDVLYTLCMYAGNESIINGQGTLYYTKELLDIDLYGDFDIDNQGNVEIDYDAYMTPLIKNASLYINPGIDGFVYFNFSRTKAIAKFDSPDRVLLKARFKATAPGEAHIYTNIEYVVNTSDVKVYNDKVPNPDINPYTVPSLEAAQYIIGDADSNWDVNIKDATLIQKICSGSSDGYTLSQTDTDLDGKVTLKDALGIRKYLVGNTPSVVGTPNFNVGVSVFASEQV